MKKPLRIRIFKRVKLLEEDMERRKKRAAHLNKPKPTHPSEGKTIPSGW